MKADIVHFVIKPDGLSHSEAKYFVDEVISHENLIIVKRKIWLVGTKEFAFLRRASLTKPYIQKLQNAYLNKDHEILRISLEKVAECEVEFILKKIKSAIREKFAQDFLINVIHVPDMQEIEEENAYFKHII